MHDQVPYTYGNAWGIGCVAFSALLLALSLMFGGCATTRADERTTTPAAPTPVADTDAVQAERAEAQQLVAELETDLANPPPAVPEPTPPEPFWAGYMVVNPAAPSVAILFAEDAIIDEAVLDRGVRLAPEPYGKTGWRFPVTRGGQLMSAVRIGDQHDVTAEMPIRTTFGDAKIIVEAGAMTDPADGTSLVLCSASVCGRVYKATAQRILGCEGPGCEDLVR